MIRPRRTAFSLLEVMLATATLLGCVIVLAQLAYLGRRQTHQAEDLAAAERFCLNKLNAILAGVEPLGPVENDMLDEEIGWTYSVEIEPLGRSGLAALRVTVYQDPTELGTAEQFTLVRWIRDPDALTTDFSESFFSEMGGAGASFQGEEP